MPEPCFAAFLSRIAAILGLGCVLAAGPAFAASNGSVVARSVTVTPRFEAYAKVVPIALASLRAAVPGVVAGLTAVPGQTVAAGKVIGELQGPEIAMLLAERKNAVASAQTAFHAAQQSLAVTRENRAAKLGTRQTVFEAQAALAQSRAALAAAASALAAAQASTRLQAPASGIVVARDAANGERVAAGQTILTVAPQHGLWIEADYYGADASRIHPGLQGRFTPVDGAASFAVKVASILSPQRPDGGQPVGLRPLDPRRDLVNGEAGTVVIEGAKRSVVAVPTRALILDRGKWWVLVQGPHGDERREVTPGASRGDETLIAQGLAPGTAVVVTNAYLQFHRDVAQHYQPPD
jgi:membrane fusion protein, heavy metal efflux system